MLYAGPKLENGAGTDAFAAGGSGGSASDFTDPTSAQFLVDDFISGNVETGEVGTLGWSFNNVTLSTTSVVADHPGVIRLTSSTTARQETLFLGNTGQHQTMLFGDVTEMTWVVSLPAVSSDFRVRIGLMSDLTANTPAGTYIEKLATDTSWYGACIQTPPTVTRTPALGTITAGAWAKLKMRQISSTSWGFSMNGGAEQVITSSTPTSTAGACIGIQVTASGGVARSIDLDFFSMKIKAQNR